MAGGGLADGRAGGEVPDSERPVVAPGDQDRPAVQDRGGHGVHRAYVTGERAADGGAVSQVPDPDRFVAAGGDDHYPPAEPGGSHRPHRAGMANYRGMNSVQGG